MGLQFFIGRSIVGLTKDGIIASNTAKGHEALLKPYNWHCDCGASSHLTEHKTRVMPVWKVCITTGTAASLLLVTLLHLRIEL